jgi:putative exosortase-associated protein (TIGR04073 family)
MVVVALISAMFVLHPPHALAGTSFEKFTRGLTNIVTAPFEFFRQPFVLHREHEFNGVAAFFGGIFSGVYATVARELAGLYEFVTFPFPIPAEYRSVIDPPTVFSGYQLPSDYKS